MSRSSSASHFSKDHETATAGIASETFWGIELESSFLDVPLWQYVVVVAVGVAVPFIVPWYAHGFDTPPSGNTLQTIVSTMILMTYLVVFGLGGGIMGIMPESTIIPVLSAIIYTRTSYPYPVVVGHCLSASASYRKNHEDHHHHQQQQQGSESPSSPPPSYLQSLLGTFFLYGFGGSIVSDLLMGLPVTALSHPRIIPCYLLCWVLCWYSPFDFVYQYICRGNVISSPISNNKKVKSNNVGKSLFYFLLVGVEAIDAVTTPMGRISRSARELKNKTTGPIMAGLLAGIGGAVLRFAASEPGTSRNFQSALEAGFLKTISYSLLWWSLAVMPCLPAEQFSSADSSWVTFNHFYSWTTEEERKYNHCNAYNGSDTLRVIIVSMHVMWTLLADVGIVSGHPLVWLLRNVLIKSAKATCQFLRCGNLETVPVNPTTKPDDAIESKKHK